MVSLIYFCSNRSYCFFTLSTAMVKIRGNVCPGELNSAIKMTFYPCPFPSFLDTSILKKRKPKNCIL